jgi:hypothetical protein
LNIIFLNNFVGAVHLHDCSIEYLIPIWLIVSGCAPILFGGMGKQSNDEDGDSNICAQVCGAIGFLFNLSWLICGKMSFSIMTETVSM